MAIQFLTSTQTTSDQIAPISSFKIKMSGTSQNLSNWVLECAEKDIADDNKDWVPYGTHDFASNGGQVKVFEGSSGYVYRLRRSSGAAGATATWGNIYTVVWR